MRASSNAFAKKERVWVAVRIRPLLELEQLARERTAWDAVGSNTLQHVDPDKPAAQCTSYQYNRVFPDSSSSEQVYTEAAAGLVAASMRGYNSTIFAYGQTGSGKTYTMQAIMAAAAQDMFQAISHDPSREFIIRMAAVEIYNEVVRDLLRDNSPGLKLLDDPLKGTVAEGLSEAGVQSEQHLQQLLAEVEARRQVSRHRSSIATCNLRLSAVQAYAWQTWAGTVQTTCSTYPLACGHPQLQGKHIAAFNAMTNCLLVLPQTRATRMNDNSSRSHEIVRLYIESRPASAAAGECRTPSTSGLRAIDDSMDLSLHAFGCLKLEHFEPFQKPHPCLAPAHACRCRGSSCR